MFKKNSYISMLILIFIMSALNGCKIDIDPIAEEPATVAVINSEDGTANATIVAGCFEFEKKDTFSIILDKYPEGVTAIYTATPIPDTLRINGLRIAVSGTVFDTKAVNRCDNNSATANKFQMTGLKKVDLSDEDEDEFSTNCDWQIIREVTLSSELQDKLDSVFSKKNVIFSALSYDTTMLIINTQHQLLEYCNDNSVISQIDFENQTVIAGCFLTNSISNEILNRNLLYCEVNNKYKFEINVKYCAECYEALGFLYFWEIVPKINNNIQLSIN
jgi:hypothetical protein